MRKFLTALCCWLLAGPALGAATPLAEMGAGPQVLVSYQGPGDVVSGATAWYGLRAYNAAYATGTNKAINVRRASDNTTQDINILTTGALDIASANTFATQDATASCTSATTTVACTAASSTPHVGSTITGAGLTQPCYAISVGTFTAGAGSVTTNGCGTVSVAVSTTFQYGLYVTEAYDQTGNGNHVLQATAARQPQLLPLCINSLSCMNFTIAANTRLATGAVTAIVQPMTTVWMAERTGSFTALQNVLGGAQGSFAASGFNSTANTAFIYGGTTVVNIASVADSTFHATSSVLNGASSAFYWDGSSSTSLNPGAAGTSTTFEFGPDVSSNSKLNAYVTEGGLWSSAFTGAQALNVCKNEQAYYGAGNFGAAC